MNGLSRLAETSYKSVYVPYISLIVRNVHSVWRLTRDGGNEYQKEQKMDTKLEHLTGC